MLPPAEARPPALALLPAFTSPLYDRLVTLAAAIPATGRRAAANVLRAVGDLAPGHAAGYRRVPSAAGWSGLELGCALARLLLDRLVPGGPAGEGDGHLLGRPHRGPPIGLDGVFRRAGAGGTIAELPASARDLLLSGLTPAPSTAPVELSSAASFRGYVLVAQNTPLVERFVRQPNGDWLQTTFEGLDAELVLATVPVSVPLVDIYAGVASPADSDGPAAS